MQSDVQACGDGAPKFNMCMSRLGWRVKCGWSNNRETPGEREQEFETPVGTCGSIVC
jgi:hypothetical protein